MKRGPFARSVVLLVSDRPTRRANDELTRGDGGPGRPGAAPGGAAGQRTAARARGGLDQRPRGRRRPARRPAPRAVRERGPLAAGDPGAGRVASGDRPRPPRARRLGGERRSARRRAHGRLARGAGRAHVPVTADACRALDAAERSPPGSPPRTRTGSPAWCSSTPSAWRRSRRRRSSAPPWSSSWRSRARPRTTTCGATAPTTSVASASGWARSGMTSGPTTSSALGRRASRPLPAP